MWKAALLDRWVPRDWMLRTLSQAAREVAVAERPWDAVRGPASAMAASALRLGWALPDADHFITHRGRFCWSTIDMGELKVLVGEAYEKWWWNQVRPTLPSDAPCEPPLLQPLRAICRDGDPFLWRA